MSWISIRGCEIVGETGDCRLVGNGRGRFFLFSGDEVSLGILLVLASVCFLQFEEPKLSFANTLSVYSFTYNRFITLSLILWVSLFVVLLYRSTINFTAFLLQVLARNYPISILSVRTGANEVRNGNQKMEIVSRVLLVFMTPLILEKTRVQRRPSIVVVSSQIAQITNLVNMIDCFCYILEIISLATICDPRGSIIFVSQGNVSLSRTFAWIMGHYQNTALVFGSSKPSSSLFVGPNIRPALSGI